MLLAFRHGPTEPLGMLAPVLDQRQFEWSYVDLWNGAVPQIPVEQSQGLIVMGGPMSVNDPLPWLRVEEQLLMRAIDAGLPVLGICLGAQLLAKCLGARVYPMPRKEIGWFPIALTDAGRADPLFANLKPREVVFQWHGDTFELPPGAELLALSKICPRQAFRARSNLYGLQFHPEVTPEIILTWCEQDRNCGDLREAPQPIDPHQENMSQMAAHLFGNWCDLFFPR